MIKSNLKKTLLSVCAIALLAGCASKDVEYVDNNKVQSVGDKAVTAVNDKVVAVVDDKTEQIVGEETAVTNVLSDELKTLTHQGVHNIESSIDNNVIVLESVHFAFDKYNMNDEMREVATTNYNKISKVQEVYGSLKVKLEGNCDEWGTDEYNYALGLKRAKTAKDALVADGINPDAIIMVSFGESNPICTQKNANCWKMNRRVDYRLLP